MKRNEVYAFFGGRIPAAKALEVTPQALSLWGDDVPPTRVAHVKLAMQVEQARRDRLEKQARKRAKKEEGRDVRKPEVAANQ